MNTKLLFAFGIAVGLSASSQANAQGAMPENSNGSAPLFAVHMTTRTVQAVNYQHHGGQTKIDFAGTAIMPSASGVIRETTPDVGK